MIDEEEATILDIPGGPKSVIFEGKLYPRGCTPRTIRTLQNLSIRDSDVFVCGYPRSGTTFTRHIVAQLLLEDYDAKKSETIAAHFHFDKDKTGKTASEADGRLENPKREELIKLSPLLEETEKSLCEAIPNPRLFPVYLPCGNFPISPTAKYVFICRNPKDTVVSRFHLYKDSNPLEFADGKFEIYFDCYMEGNLSYGDYFNHLLSWLPHFQDRNVLVLRYEDLCNNLPGSVKKIGDFLGGRAAALVASQDEIDKIVQCSQFDAMKKDQNRWKKDNFNNFIRKGGTGNWRNNLTIEQSMKIDEKFAKSFRGTQIENWWCEEMQF